MVRHKYRNWIWALMLVISLEISGCVKEGGVTPRVLEGRWELVRVNGTSYTDRDFFWEFEEDGDFEFSAYGEVYKGDWSWNSGKDELDIEWTDSYGDRYFTEFEVEVLDNEHLEGEWSYDGERYVMEFERD